MRYDRADINSSLRAATSQAVLGGKPAFVFATAGGFTVSRHLTGNGFQSYYRAEADGRVFLIEREDDGQRKITPVTTR